jgi:uncharacterized membrane protein
MTGARVRDLLCLPQNNFAPYDVSLITIDVSETIKRPVGEVFEFFTNIENLKNYMKGVTTASWLPPGYTGVGSKFRIVRTSVGISHDITFEVTKVQPNKQFSFRTIDGSKVDFGGGITFEEVEGGTRVTLTSEAEEPRGIFKLAVPMFVRTVREELEMELANVKRALEGQ